MDGGFRAVSFAERYKKGRINNLVDVLSRPPTSKITSFGTIMYMDPFTHDAYREAYSEVEDFKEVYK